MIVAFTGITGNMGQAVLEQVLKNPKIDKFVFLVLNHDRRIKKLLRKHKEIRSKCEVIYGSLANAEACRKLVSSANYVVNMAAVIPPLSDQCPEKAVECNQIGVNTLVSEIEKLEHQPKLIHISTVALYGNRAGEHLWGRVGDPLLCSPLDIYSATKLRGEWRVLESSVKNWVVLRQTAMLHKHMLSDNLNDGLMFHTCFNAPLEWVTAHDSGVLINNILSFDIENDLGNKFWHHCFNIGGGEVNCKTGYDVLNDGFSIIGGEVKDFFKPNNNATRNFHGMWFYDSQELNNLFHFQSQSTADFWREFLESHAYFKLGKIVPKGLIRKLAIERLFSDKNAPKYWVKHDDKAKIQAFFGGIDKFNAIGTDWDTFDLLIENREKGKNIDYASLNNRANAKLIDYGYDISKPDADITLEDLQNVANMHGGTLISDEFDGDLYKKLKWKNSDNVEFEATPYTIVRAGHWLNKLYFENCWEFDRLARLDKIYAQVWYDSHDKNEDYTYYLDGNYDAQMFEGPEKPKNILICYFSGTGNTKKIVNKYVEELARRHQNVTVYRIEEGNFDLDLGEFDMLGIAYPIHAFNAPSIIVDFVKKLKKQPKHIKTFILKTSGEPLALNNISSTKIKKLLRRRNFILTNEYHYVMPYNIIFRHSNNMAYKMWETAQNLVPVHCSEILGNQNSKLSSIFFGGLLAWVFRIEYWGGRFNGKRYKINENCIKCQKCVRACPTHNITIKNGEIEFGDKCIMCMRCSFFCPTNAIKIGLFNSWKVNGEYNFNDYSADEEQTHKKFCKKSYAKYFNKSEKKIAEYKAKNNRP